MEAYLFFLSSYFYSIKCLKMVVLLVGRMDLHRGNISSARAALASDFYSSLVYYDYVIVIVFVYNLIFWPHFLSARATISKVDARSRWMRLPFGK